MTVIDATTTIRPTRNWAPREAPSGYLEGRRFAATSVTFDAAGYRFAMRADDEEVVAETERLFSAFRAADGIAPEHWYSWIDRGDQVTRSRYALYLDRERITINRSRQGAFTMVLHSFNGAAIHDATGRFVALHAAAAERDGVSVVLPAPQESGKTTTVTGLLLAGYRYYTDEAVLIDPGTLTVHPFPKVLTIDPGSQPLFSDTIGYVPTALDNDQWHVDLPSLGVEVAPTRPAGIVVFPRFSRGAATALTPLERADAVMRLAEVTFDFLAAPRRNLPTLASLVTAVPCYELVIGDLDEAVGCIGGLVAAHAS